MVQVHLGPPNRSHGYYPILKILEPGNQGFLPYWGSGVSWRHEEVAVTHPLSRCWLLGVPQGHRS
jgi:hypothetical protein